MKLFSSLLLSLMFCLSTSCSTAPQSPMTGRPESEVLRAIQENKIEKGEKELDNFKFNEALETFQEFQAVHQMSPYLAQVKMGEARAQEGLGRWEEAATLYRQVIELTRNQPSEFAAVSLYRISFCYEALGSEAKTLASLLDAEKFKDKLSPEIALAELPARLAASYYRAGRFKESSSRLDEAEAGIRQLQQMKAKEASKTWLAQTYLQMGIVSTNDLSFENFKRSLDTLKIVQIYLLKSAEVADEKWSPLAAQTLVQVYKDLTQIVSEVPLNRSKDALLAQREQSDRKAFLAGQILESLNRLRALRLDFENEQSEKLLEDVFAKLGLQEDKLIDLLNRDPVSNSLTAESAKRQRVKKNIEIKSEPFFPNEKKAGRK